MTATDVRSNVASETARVTKVDMKLEVVTIPVSDLDRAKEFHGRLGWRLDADFSKGDDRVIQFTPPGSDTSVHLGTNVTSAAPGSAQSMYLIVSDIRAAHDELVQRHYADGPARFGAPVGGRAPDQGSYGSYASFDDPDGNTWLFQEVTTRLPGRIESGGTSFASARDLAQALRHAAAADGDPRTDTREDDAEWPERYAATIVAERAGTPPRG